ncbi:MAG: hypothetical protein WCL00_07585 [Bacteroidota bacterium]
MNRIIGLFIFCVFATSFGIVGQNIPNYPFPSNNVSVNGYANFANLNSVKECNPKRERQVNIHLKSGSVGNPNCEATIWVYSLDQTTVFGPYTLNCGETLTIKIDGREWGGLVESEEEVIVDVWYSTGGNKCMGEIMIQKNKMQNEKQNMLLTITHFLLNTYVPIRLFL